MPLLILSVNPGGIKEEEEDLSATPRRSRRGLVDRSDDEDGMSS